MSWAERPTIAAGEFPRANEIETVLDQIEWEHDSLPITVTGADGTTTSASYTSTISGNSTTTTFVARKTSHVIEVSAFMLNSGASGPFDQYMSFAVTATGFATYGPSDADAVRTRLTNNNTGITGARSTVVSGLTIGTTYTVTGWFKTSGSTVSFTNPRIVIH